MSSPLRSGLLLFLPSLVLLWAVLSPLEAGAQRPACSLEAGLWLAPHGQSNDGVARASGAFLRKPDGTSASITWEGTWLVDPTRPEAHTYLRDLFHPAGRGGDGGDPLARSARRPAVVPLL
jgi:hypothetical protein